MIYNKIPRHETKSFNLVAAHKARMNPFPALENKLPKAIAACEAHKELAEATAKKLVHFHQLLHNH